jgi:hypothetical protein
MTAISHQELLRARLQAAESNPQLRLTRTVLQAAADQLVLHLEQAHGWTQREALQALHLELESISTRHISRSL